MIRWRLKACHRAMRHSPAIVRSNRCTPLPFDHSRRSVVPLFRHPWSVLQCPLTEPVWLQQLRQSSPTEYLLISRELDEIIPSDQYLCSVLRTPRPAVSPSKGSEAVGLTTSEVLLFPRVVDALMPLLPLLPATNHELLLLLGRYYNVGDAVDTSSHVCRQLLQLLANVAEYTNDANSSSEALAHVRLLALTCLIASPSSITDAPRMTMIHSELRKCRHAIPTEVLESLFAAAHPELCSLYLEHTLERFKGMPALKGAKSNRFLARMEADAFFSLWAALLANDYSFHPQHIPRMHALLLRLVEGVELISPSSPLLVPAINKSARVYSKARRGQALHELHRAFFTRHPGALRRQPWQYYTSFIGCLLDEATDIVEGVVVADSQLTAQTPVLSASEYWSRLVLPVLNEALALHALNKEARDNLWKISFKCAMLLPYEDHSLHRLLECYDAFANHGAPTAMSKEQLAQLLRVFSQSLRDPVLHAVVAGSSGDTLSHYSSAVGSSGDIAPLEVEACSAEKDSVAAKERLADHWGRVVRMLCSILVRTPSVDMHMALNATDAVLAALCSEEALMTIDIRRQLGAYVYEWVHQTFLPQRHIAGTDVSNISTTRLSLEKLGILPASPFWWTCGCTASNSSFADVCSKCMRNTHDRWECPCCHTRHKKAMPECSQCHASHPYIVAAEERDLPLCDRCDLSALDGDMSCSRCGDGRSQPRTSFVCSACDQVHRSRVNCPRCGEKTNVDEALAMWLCTGCQRYNYAFSKECPRCSKEGASSVRSSKSLRVPYTPWRCGCGHTNPMPATGCGWCGEGTMFACPSCNKKSRCSRTRQVRVLTDARQDLFIRVTVCESCGEYHPRDVAVLCSPHVLVPCYRCGGAAAIGADCPHCSAPHGDFNPLLPFWCEVCDGTGKALGEEAGQRPAQDGFACRGCGTPRPELSACCFLWRCDNYLTGREDREDRTCGAWNPSWLAACRSCRQPRVQDKFEARCRHLGRWTCPIPECKATNRAEDVLLCTKCSDGLQVPPPCPPWRMAHLAFQCPSTALRAKMTEAAEQLHAIVAANEG